MKTRLTKRVHGIVSLQKDGQLVPPMNMSGQEVRQVMERLEELEDAEEQRKVVCARCIKHDYCDRKLV